MTILPLVRSPMLFVIVVGDLDISSSTTTVSWPVFKLCSVCKAHIGGDNHNARKCCKKSARVFPKVHVLILLLRRVLIVLLRRKPVAEAASLLLPAPNLTTPPTTPSSSKTYHSTSTSSQPAPYNTHGEAVKDLLREVVAAMATLNKFAEAGGDLEEESF